MFVNACNQIRESIYGLMGLSQLGPNAVNASNGTGFMIAPGLIATAGHLCHVNGDPTQPQHQLFEAIRSPDVGQAMETATFVAEDTQRDIALLRIAAPRSGTCVTLEANQIPTGTRCGALGFPLASVSFSPTGRLFNLQERFQSASVSAYATTVHASGVQLMQYETDAFMYSGSSGCPGFLEDSRVFAMHVASRVEQNPSGSSNARLAIAVWVPAAEIRAFAQANGAAI